MKKGNKVLLGIVFLTMLFSISSFSNVLAVDQSYEGISQEVGLSTQLQAHVRTTFRYQAQTRLTINCSVDCDLLLSCEASKIGAKDFEMELTTSSDLEMNMTCTEEQAELGLLLGARQTLRNRNRYIYQEAFCVSLQCNATEIQAKLMIQATAQNGGGSWAYYDESSGEWVTVPTVIENGYLVTTTNHFSTWTILIPEVDIIPYIIAGVIIGIIATISIIGIVIYRKKR